MATTSTEEFDWDAFMRDTLEASAAATGAWLRCLYKMRLSVTRGRLSWPLASFARLFGMSADQAKAVISEIETLGIGDAVTESNGNITLTNRRIFRAFQDAESNKNRQARYREAHKAPDDVEVQNGEVTEMSQNEKSECIYSSLNPSNQDNKKEEKKKNTPPEIVRVFTYWQTELKHPTAILTNDRQRKIAARLKEGYSVQDLELAIDGCKKSPHHMGQNEQAKIYDGIDLIFRNGSKVEQFIGYNRTVQQKNGQQSKFSEREKSANRSVNAERFADELERQARQELADMEAVSGSCDSTFIEIDSPREPTLLN
jgi:hypothetical protein